ncbi:hypothetical protein CPC08DRAFT_590148, partial [Agrocybe pediades]
DIRVEYHPSSKRRTEYCESKDFRTASAAAQNCSARPSYPPWHPFRTRLDFELCEFIQEAHLNAGQIDSLISLMDEALKDPKSFTLSGSQDVTNLWSLARRLSEGFTEHTFTCKYKKQDRSYVVWSRPIWEWCTELLNDKDLITEFSWDAEKVSIFLEDGGNGPERRIDEPWTADAWWDIQSALPAGAKPFFILLYADKTHLSSFGLTGEKGYPILARCANLPTEIRNSNDSIGGARLVGWLPIVRGIFFFQNLVVLEDPGEAGKKKFVDLKRIVWHKGFSYVLESIKDWAKTGYWYMCADDIQRLIFPIILMLSSDYEEQCIMAAIRGLNSLFPCPVCLVPEAELCNLSRVSSRRTTDHMRSIYEESQLMNAKQREKHLISYGLRNVQNVFWEYKYTDVYAAISWDRLHAYHGGLFKAHLWEEFKIVVEQVGGRDSQKKIDEQCISIPPYRGLHRFKEVMKTDFADGSKWEDISKIIVYSSHNVLSAASSKRRYHLLRLIRSYLELDMYASLTVHTESSITKGREEMQNYNRILQQYIAKYDTKSWDFPKSHTHIHMFEDILRKGATRNYNTKINEKRHAPLKKYYRNQVNFKDVGAQILKLDHNSLAALLIRRTIQNEDIRMDTSGNDESSVAAVR